MQESTGTKGKLIWAKTLTRWMTLAKALDLSKPQFPCPVKLDKKENLDENRMLNLIDCDEPA